MRTFSSRSHVGLISTPHDRPPVHLWRREVEVRTTAPAHRRRLLVAAMLVALFAALFVARLERGASAEPKTSDIPASCAIGGSSMSVTIPLTVDDKIDPV